MKRLFVLLAVTIVLVSCAKDTHHRSTANDRDSSKVLLFIREGSMDLESMLRDEVRVIEATLEEAGFRVEIATITGAPMSAGSAALKPGLKTADVAMAEYAGFILPCMAVNDYEVQPDAEAVALVKEAVALGIPVAAQLGSTRTLAKAGVLNGKKYASALEFDDPYFAGSIFSGMGIVKDGDIITSGICPYMASNEGIKDGTKDLTLALINTIRAKAE